jgi:ribosomal protein S18 acetylase RimI-like enzyme
MTIRIANSDDVYSISRLYDDFYRHNSSQQPFFYTDAKESGDYPQSVIDGTTGDIFVAEIENVIIGFIHVEEDKTPPYPAVVQHRFACIVDFYVIPEYRKRGIGKALLEKAKDWSVNLELDYIELFVLEENEIGKGFYKKENFETASRTMRFIFNK